MTRLAGLLLAAALSFLSPASHAQAPILVGLDAEVGDATSTSDEAIRTGIRLAMDEINARGGLLGGRKLQLVERDNRSVPARGLANARELAAMPGLVAFFCGKFSPVAVEHAKVANETGALLLDPWAAADNIVDNGAAVNHVFRLSLRDSWAIAALLKHAQARGLTRVGLLVPNSGWGRSSSKAAETYVATKGGLQLVSTQWYNWGGDMSFLERYRAMRDAGAQAVVLVANEREAAALVKEVAALPAAERLPILSHWGLTGGDFPALAGPALSQVDLVVVQTFALGEAKGARAQRVVRAALETFKVVDPARVPSAVGLIHAYDLTHLLAAAIERAGSAERAAVRAELQRLPAQEGLMKRYARPFAPDRHEALSEADLFLARFSGDGRLLRDARGRP